MGEYSTGTEEVQVRFARWDKYLHDLQIDLGVVVPWYS